MEMLDWPGLTGIIRVEWRSASITSMAQCVMMAGTMLMLQWSVASLGFKEQVSFLQCCV